MGPTENTIIQTSEHNLKFMNFQYPRNIKYIPWEKIEHKRKKTVFLPFSYDIYTRNLDQFKKYLYEIYNNQKFTFKITFEFYIY